MARHRPRLGNRVGRGTCKTLYAVSRPAIRWLGVFQAMPDEMARELRTRAVLHGVKKWLAEEHGVARLDVHIPLLVRNPEFEGSPDLHTLSRPRSVADCEFLLQRVAPVRYHRKVVPAQLTNAHALPEGSERFHRAVAEFIFLKWLGGLRCYEFEIIFDGRVHWFIDFDSCVASGDDDDGGEELSCALGAPQSTPFADRLRQLTASISKNGVQACRRFIRTVP